MATDIELTDLGNRLAALIEDRLGGIAEPVQEVLPGAADIYIAHAKRLTKEKGIFDDKSEEQHFIDSWGKKKKKKYPKQIFVGNTKKVKGGDSENIPLINIIEYGTSGRNNLKPRPILDDALEAAADEIFDMIASAVENNL
jgi:hypothetical protein